MQALARVLGVLGKYFTCSHGRVQPGCNAAVFTPALPVSTLPATELGTREGCCAWELCPVLYSGGRTAEVLLFDR